MIASLLATLTLSTLPSAHEPIDLNPTDDAWVYPHAGDQQTDEFLRIWGQEGMAVPSDVNDRDNFSFGYLRFDVERCPAGKKLQSAELILTHMANPGFKFDDVRKAPIQVRGLKGSFTEKTWNFDLGAKLFPSAKKDDFFGEGFPKEIPADVPFRITVDLLKGPQKFGDFLNKALAEKEKAISLALVSTIDPSVVGRQGIYKVYSRNHKEDAQRRPVLRLVFEDETVLVSGIASR